MADAPERWGRTTGARLVVRVELEPAEIEVLVERGYLDPKDRENLGPIQEAANNFISDALATS